MPDHELAARAHQVAERLNQLADAAESGQPEAVGSWMRHVREIHASVRGELMTAVVAVERAAGASWTAIGAAQDPPVGRQAVQQRYRRLARRTDVNSEVDTVVKSTPEPTRHTETSAPRPSTKTLTACPGVPVNAGPSSHAQSSPLAACGLLTTGAT